MARKPKPSQAPSPLLDAIKFCASICDGDLPYQTHLAIANGTVTSYNGLFAAGSPIPTDLFVAPNAELLTAALSKVGDNVSITLLDGKLSIKSEKAKFLIPCVSFDVLTFIQPDIPQAPIDDKLKAAFTNCIRLIRDDANPGFANGVLLNGPTCVSTDRNIIIEYYHGLYMPTGLIVPKPVASFVGKHTKSLAQFGCSDRSVTFYFQDGSWVKSQLYEDTYPDVARVLDANVNPKGFPKDFWNAVDIVAPHSEDGAVRLSEGRLHSHSGDAGASYDVAVPSCHNLSVRYLKIIEPIAKRIDFVGERGITFWFGENCRGAIAGVI